MTKVLATVSIIVTIGLLALCGVNQFVLYRDIDSYINRAQVAGEADDMLQYTDLVMTNMVAHNASSGNTALLFKTPDTDLGLEFKVLERVHDRLTEIIKLPHTDTSYQVALDDIRGIMRELKNPSSAIAWRHYWWWSIIVLIVAWALTGWAAYYEDYL